MQQVGCLPQTEIKMYPLAFYGEGAGERQWERQREWRGREMFGIRVGKLSALGIVPDGHKPLPPFINSLLSSPLLSYNACYPQLSSHFAQILGPSPENMNKLTLFVFLLFLFFWQLLLSPCTSTTTAPNPCHFQSQHTTKCRADSLPLWVALFPIFSLPHHLGRKEKTFVQKKK